MMTHTMTISTCFNPLVFSYIAAESALRDEEWRRNGEERERKGELGGCSNPNHSHPAVLTIPFDLYIAQQQWQRRVVKHSSIISAASLHM